MQQQVENPCRRASVESWPASACLGVVGPACSARTVEPMLPTAHWRPPGVFRKESAVDPRRIRQQLRDHNPAPPEVVDEAIDIVSDAKRAIAGKYSPIASRLSSIARTEFTTKDNPTAAVALMGDGIPWLLINPQFAVQVGVKGMVFVLIHEAYHLVFSHLFRNLYEGNPNWTTAQETVVNRHVMTLTGMDALTWEDENGNTASVVDPEKIYTQYRDKAREAGISRVGKTEFLLTDMSCMRELCRLPKPVSQRNSYCPHKDGKPSSDTDPGSGAGSSSPSDPTPSGIDPEEAGKVVEKVFHDLVAEAKAGNKEAAREILDLADTNPELEHMWGDLGVDALRGETTRTRTTDQWEKWTADAVATRLADGNRLRYQKKIWWDPRITPHGKVEQKQGVVAIDTSGSMPADLVNKVADLVQDHEEMEVTWLAFDAAVHPFAPGEELRGGGGTRFDIIDNYIDEELDEDPDFVLVVTDGYAESFMPREPESWIWLITPHGSMWPETPPYLMATREIDEQELTASR